MPVRKLGFRNVWCESDSLEVINVLHDLDRRHFHKHASILNDINNLVERQWNVKFDHIFSADFLAKYGAAHDLNWKIWNSAPTSMGALLLKDSLG